MLRFAPGSSSRRLSRAEVPRQKRAARLQGRLSFEISDQALAGATLLFPPWKGLRCKHLGQSWQAGSERKGGDTNIATMRHVHNRA